MAATERNIRLIVETIIASHPGMATHVEHNAQDTPFHHSFSLLISVECIGGGTGGGSHGPRPHHFFLGGLAPHF